MVDTNGTGKARIQTHRPNPIQIHAHAVEWVSHKWQMSASCGTLATVANSSKTHLTQTLWQYN